MAKRQRAAPAAAACVQTENGPLVTPARVIEELARMAFANMLDYMSVTADGDAYVDLSQMTREQAAAVSEVIVEDFMDGRGDKARQVRRVRFKLADKRAALVELAKQLGMGEPRVRVEVGISPADILRAVEERSAEADLAE